MGTGRLGKVAVDLEAPSRDSVSESGLPGESIAAGGAGEGVRDGPELSSSLTTASTLVTVRFLPTIESILKPSFGRVTGGPADVTMAWVISSVETIFQ